MYRRTNKGYMPIIDVDHQDSIDTTQIQNLGKYTAVRYLDPTSLASTGPQTMQSVQTKATLKTYSNRPRRDTGDFVRIRSLEIIIITNLLTDYMPITNLSIIK